MSSEENQNNQTTFAQEQPLLERVEPLPRRMDEQVVVKKAWYKNKLVLVAMGFGTVVLLLLLLLVLAGNGGQAEPEVVEEEETVTAPMDDTELSRRVRQLQDELEAGDPTKQDLVFPPVDLTLRLDPKKR